MNAEERDQAPLPVMLSRLYAARFPQDEHAARDRLWSTLCRSFFRQFVPPDGTVLDLGAGFCDFINNVESRRRIAIDLNPETAHMAAEGVEVHAVPLADLERVIDPATVDLAFASNVFEHLASPDELLAVLGAVRRTLSDRGQLVILQPNIRLVRGRFWDFFDHTLPLTERGMSEALHVAGYDVIERRARFLPYTTKSRLPMWPWLVRAYLALRPAQFVFGRQMLVVARPISPHRHTP